MPVGNYILSFEFLIQIYISEAIEPSRELFICTFIYRITNSDIFFIAFLVKEKV